MPETSKNRPLRLGTTLELFLCRSLMAVRAKADVEEQRAMTRNSRAARRCGSKGVPPGETGEKRNRATDRGGSLRRDCPEALWTVESPGPSFVRLSLRAVTITAQRHVSLPRPPWPGQHRSLTSTGRNR